MKQPRFMLAAPSSGSGKTMITCGILQILKNRGYRVSSFKCGPDYIDPMFHTKVLGTISRNLDTFFTGEEMTRFLFAKTAQQTDLSVIEGVMGYYDGLGGIRTKASSYDLARVTDTPVILIVNAKGMSLSILAQIKGFLDYQKDSKIKGVILNQTSEMTCRMLTPKIESELGICVFGYVPKIADWHLESRHLGLVLPDEISDLREQMQRLADILEKTLDIESILQMAEGAKEMEDDMPKSLKQLFADPHVQKIRTQRPQIAVAKDEAFCFLYEDNLKLLEELGAEITFFSPLHNAKVPENADGLLLPGGYPELFAAGLSENSEMLASIRSCEKKAIPILAECGGFMYLHQEMQDMEGKTYPMAGVINAVAYRTEKLGRFGYITLDLNEEQAEARNIWQQGFPVRAHEFHYFDSTDPGSAVAKDEAFCFLYEDNLKLLEELGAEITFFSPLHNAKVPENADGLLLPGGYPELFAAGLSENSEMLASIRSCEKKAIPILAECGGFMYLHQEMQDMEGKTYPMAGVINAVAYRTEKLGRFGYITLDLNEEQAEARNIWQQGFPVRAHEFHYFDSTDPGSACLAKKPAGKRSWSCSYAKDGSLMGFPHLYYYSNPMFAFRFLENCMAKKLEREKVS